MAITQYRWHDDNATQAKNAKRNVESGLRVLRLIKHSSYIKMSSEECRACDRVLIGSIREYLYICSIKNFESYVDGLKFIKSLFGFWSALVSLNLKHIVRSIIL